MLITSVLESVNWKLPWFKPIALRRYWLCVFCVGVNHDGHRTSVKQTVTRPDCLVGYCCLTPSCLRRGAGGDRDPRRWGKRETIPNTIKLYNVIARMKVFRLALVGWFAEKIFNADFSLKKYWPRSQEVGEEGDCS